MNNSTLSIADQIVAQLLATSDKDTVKYVYEKLRDHFTQKPTVVYFAGEMSDKEKQELETAIKGKFPQSETVEFIKDDSLLGGIKVVFEDYVYEDSVARRLASTSN
ncbi:hypothetical protein CO180_02705 [candidate division WWE3 bacterium CG_4_9_14_3_um_filter_41_6]|uniref:Uncharacterized protein n=1 Tax=candidate division WWE3 bacterium CG_4_10_14_0_2_um_filter_41_14 TaxID=1975072 RepID=A0A2M7TJG3_UNCKA|nr:MAG: hypothetical protein COY32_02930 [candidate division WWE3 bacterium CG_4_10_14_0_2_um_filter_41_14]PJA38724.1 MAG: hypothetical protein CO180_02705 [candidate division WWE3 bacterium CG_4_9_14_3_um_filter_41_6]